MHKLLVLTLIFEILPDSLTFPTLLGGPAVAPKIAVLKSFSVVILTALRLWLPKNFSFEISDLSMVHLNWPAPAWVAVELNTFTSLRSYLTRLLGDEIPLPN